MRVISRLIEASISPTWSLLWPYNWRLCSSLAIAANGAVNSSCQCCTQRHTIVSLAQPEGVNSNTDTGRNMHGLVMRARASKKFHRPLSKTVSRILSWMPDYLLLNISIIASVDRDRPSWRPSIDSRLFHRRDDHRSIVLGLFHPEIPEEYVWWKSVPEVWLLSILYGYSILGEWRNPAVGKPNVLKFPNRKNKTTNRIDQHLRMDL